MTVPVDTVHAQLGSNNVLLTHIGSNRWQGTFTIPSSNFAGSHQIFFVARTGEVIVGTRQFPVSVAPIISTVSVTPTGILTPTLKTFNQQKGNTKLSCEIPFFHNLVVAVYAIFARWQVEEDNFDTRVFSSFRWCRRRHGCLLYPENI